jgi:GNAT superfamily N-acetyltransferase
MTTAATARRDALTIAPLDPANAAEFEAAYQVLVAAREHDVPDLPRPCRNRFQVQTEVPWPGEESLRSIARDGNDVVGFLDINFPTLDNLENAFVDIVVPPRHRRRGVGRLLYEHTVATVRAEGRRRIMAFTAFPLPDGAPREAAGSEFAAALGMTSALDEVRRRLDVAAVQPAVLDRMLADAWARADGYSLVRWTDRVPDDCVDDVAALDSQFIDEAPMGDLAIEAEKVDRDRVRALEAARTRYGSRPFSTALRHDATGRVVAWSALTQEHSHVEHAWQGITLVHPGHRGHRLGLISKIENLRYARQHLPRLRYIDTWNAAVNEHMIAINEAMGFRPVDAWHNWTQDV